MRNVRIMKEPKGFYKSKIIFNDMCFKYTTSILREPTLFCDALLLKS